MGYTGELNYLRPLKWKYIGGLLDLVKTIIYFYKILHKEPDKRKITMNRNTSIRWKFINLFMYYLMFYELNSPIPIHFSSLIPKMSMFILVNSCLTIVQLTLIHRPNIPGYYAILFFIALDFTFSTRSIHHWASFLLWPVTSFFLELLVMPSAFPQ